MGDFTSFAAKTWRWRRWRGLDATTRLLWLGLYTSLHAKRMVPGLWHGSIALMVEETGLSPEQTIRSLDRLLEVDLVEYDRETDVVRMTELPDTGEWPSNERWIQGWWNRFCLIPQCPIRDVHVTTLRWVLDEGAKDRGKLVSKNVNDAWLETFGRIEVPAQRRRGVLRLEGDSDTSTSVQPSLFSSSVAGRPSTPPDVSTTRASADPIPSSSGIVSEATSGESLKRGSIDPLRDSGTGSGTGPGLDLLLPGGSGGLSTGRPKLVLVPGPGRSRWTSSTPSSPPRRTGPACSRRTPSSRLGTRSARSPTSRASTTCSRSCAGASNAGWERSRARARCGLPRRDV